MREAAMEEKCGKLADKLWNFMLDESPEFATYRGFPRAENKLDSFSLKTYKRREDFCQEILQETAIIRVDALDSKDRVTLEMIQYYARSCLDGLPWAHHLMPVSDLLGPDIYFTHYTLAHTTCTTEQNYLDYICRLKAFPKQIEETIALMDRGLELRVIQRKGSLTEKSLRRISKLWHGEPTDISFYKPFLNIPDTVSSKRDLQLKGSEAIRDYIFPAFKQLSQYIEKNYLPQVLTQPSIEEMPGPPGRYKAMLRFYCDVEDWETPQSLHQVGQEEVARIQTQIQQVQKELQFSGSFQEFVQFLRGNPSLFCKTEEELLEFIRDTIEDIKPSINKIFKTASSRQMNVVATHTLGGTIAMYTSPPAQSGKPGTLFVNVSDLASFPKYEVLTLMLHEAEPGHHLQACVALDNESLPNFRRLKDDRRYTEPPSNFPFNSAYTEGWGMYCETLGEELGLYDDLYTRFGYLCHSLGRACRLVAETGIHAMGWSQQDVVDYLLKTTAMTEARALEETCRYVSVPGQAACYKIGEFQMLDIRRKAEKELGDLFDLREYHDMVLQCGQVPLSILRHLVARYIQERKEGLELS